MKALKFYIKAFILAATILWATGGYSQNKPDVSKKEITAPTKPQYQKVVQIPIEDFNLLTQQLNERKNAVIYQPEIKPEDAVNIQKQIDAYLNELPKRVKLDSIPVTTK